MTSTNASSSSLPEDFQRSPQYDANQVESASYDLQEEPFFASSTLISPHQPDEISPADPTQPPKTLKYLDCLAIVLSLQIGSGIFSAPSVVSSHVSSSWLGVLVWLLAGGLVWTGAASFIELGTSIPENGGIQEYLRHCYGDLYGFLFAWIWIVVAKPCSMAMISLIFSEYFYKAALPDTDISVWILKVTAIIGIALITGLNCMGTRTGIKTANTFMGIKLLGLSSIPLAAAIYYIRASSNAYIAQQSIDFGIDHNGTERQGISTEEILLFWSGLKNIADAIFAALFSYGGWESISFVVGEITEPHRTLPRVLHSAMRIVISLSVATNVAFYAVLSREDIGRTNAVALAFGQVALGRLGAIFYAWIVCLSCLGSLNAFVFSIGRLTQSAGQRKYLPAFLKTAATLHRQKPRSVQDHGSWTEAPVQAENIPSNAMLFNACLSTMYVLIGSFRGLLAFKGLTLLLISLGMAEYIVFLVTVLGIFVVRHHSYFGVQQPSTKHYRTHTLNPIVFCGVSTVLILCSAVAHTMEVGIIILFFSAGACLYRIGWWRQITGRSDG